MNLFKRSVFSILANAGLFWLLAHKIFPDDFVIDGGVLSYILISVIFGLLNVLLHPIINLFTLPIRFLTLGVFSLFINGILLWLLGKTVNFLEIPEVTFTVNTLTTYVLAGLILAVSNAILHWFMKSD